MNTTLAGTVVWNFVPNWHLKVNYAQGFRPPAFNNTVTNGEAVNITGNEDLKVETSDSAQVEINARIFKGERRVRELAFRVDGSYTRLNDLIQINSGNYRNTPERRIASAEFLGKLYVQGGHRLELGYTYLKVAAEDKGLFRNLPEHSFSLASVFSLVTNKLLATSTLRVSGSAEDPNRLALYLARHEGEVVAATTLVTVGDHAWYSYGASTTASRNVRPSNAVQWRMITDSLDAGCSLYDLRGISDNLTAGDHLLGLVQFKVGTGGYAQEYVGEWDRVLRPLWNKAYEVYRSRR